MFHSSLHHYKKHLLIATASAVTVLSLTACSGDEQSVESEASTSPAMTTSSTESEDVQWGYEGDGAPANWGELDPDFETCTTGMEQSPIDLVSAEPSDLPDLDFTYVPSPWSITNNGHTVQVTPDQEQSMEVDGDEKTLLQMHLHTPSEHFVQGEKFDAEAHFVHRDSNDELTVVAVFVEEGAPNPVLEQMLAETPSAIDDVAEVQADIDLANLLPGSRAYNTYSGSLTTPPCSEDVTWIVYTDPTSASAEQITDLEALLGANVRPVQDLNGRDIENDSTVE